MRSAIDKDLGWKKLAQKKKNEIQISNSTAGSTIIQQIKNAPLNFVIFSINFESKTNLKALHSFILFHFCDLFFVNKLVASTTCSASKKKPYQQRASSRSTHTVEKQF